MKKIITYFSILLSGTVFGQQNFTTGMSSSYVIPITDVSASAISSQGMFATQSQATSTDIWYNLPVTGSEVADITISSTPIGGLAWSQDGNKLIVSDKGILKIWNSVPTTNNQLPDITTPYGSGGVVVSPDGRLVVTDKDSSYICIWNRIPNTNNTPPDLIYGGLGTANNKFNKPWGISLSPDGKFLVAEEFNNRVLIFDSIPVSVSDTAILVIGQDNFTTNTSGTSQIKLNTPIGVTVTVDGKVAISDYSNNRVMIWNSMPVTNGAPADVVLGQNDFVSSANGTSLNQMTNPYGISTDFVGRLFLSGRTMDSVMVFGEVPTDTVDLSLNTSSTSTYLCSEAGINFNFTVTNNGPDTVKNITVIAALPNKISLTNYTASIGTYNSLSGYWQIPNLLNGATATLQVSGVVDAIITPDTLLAYSSIQQADGVDTIFTNNYQIIEFYLDTITAPEVPTASDITICANESATLSTTSSDTIKWYNSIFSNTVLTTGNTYTTPNLASNTTYYLEASNGCASERVSVLVTVEVCTVDNILNDVTSSIKIYPNPVTDILNIELSSNIDRNSVSIVDILGESILTKNNKWNNGVLTLDMNNFESGIYFVVVKGIKTYKVTKR